MNTVLRVLAFLPVAAVLSGCGAGHSLRGSTQTILIDAYPRGVSAVSCIAKNEAGSYVLSDVPAHMQVNRAQGPLAVRCSSTTGAVGNKVVTATTETDAAIVDAMTLNAPGAFVDFGPKGVSYGYPVSIVVPMPALEVLADAPGGPLLVRERARIVSPRPMHHTRRTVAHRGCACTPAIPARGGS